MESRRVLILCEPGLLAHGVRSLLGSEDRLEIAGITSDARLAAEIIQNSQPVALLAEESEFPLWLGHEPASIPLNQVKSLVMLSASGNTIRTCRIEERPLRGPQDLIDALLG